MKQGTEIVMRYRSGGFACVGAVLVVSCVPDDEPVGTTAATSASTSAGQGGNGAATASSSSSVGPGGSGAGGAGTGGGAGGSTLCVPGDSEPCYSGPAGTDGIGECASGTRTCDADGAAWGPCVGEVLPSYDDCVTPATDEDCDGDTPACTGDAKWSRSMAGPQDQFATHVAIDAADNVIVSGFFQSNVQDAFGCGATTAVGTASDAFLVKLDKDGNCSWPIIKRFGDDGNDVIHGLAVTSTDDLIIVGDFTSAIDFGGPTLASAGGADVFVAKLTPGGGHVWSKRFGSAGDQFSAAVALDAAGNIVLAGYFNGTLDFGFGCNPLIASGAEHDVFVAKLDGAAGVWL